MSVLSVFGVSIAVLGVVLIGVGIGMWVQSHYCPAGAL